MPTRRYIGVCRGTARTRIEQAAPIFESGLFFCVQFRRSEFLRIKDFYNYYSSLYSPLWSVTSHAREHLKAIEAWTSSSSRQVRGFFFLLLNVVRDIPIFSAFCLSVTQLLISPCAQMFRITTSLAADIGDGFSFGIILTSLSFILFILCANPSTFSSGKIAKAKPPILFRSGGFFRLSEISDLQFFFRWRFRAFPSQPLCALGQSMQICL